MQNFWVSNALLKLYILCKIMNFLILITQKLFSKRGLNYFGHRIMHCIFSVDISVAWLKPEALTITNTVNKDYPIIRSLDSFVGTCDRLAPDSQGVKTIQAASTRKTETARKPHRTETAVKRQPRAKRLRENREQNIFTANLNQIKLQKFWKPTFGQVIHPPSSSQ